MTGVIIKDTMRSNWKSTLYWGCGIGILGIYLVAIASSSDIIGGYVTLLESLPPAMLSAFGINDVRMFSTAEGWITSGFVSYAMLMLSFYAVMAGLNITVNEEDNGVLDIMLALPISRTQVIIEKSIAYALLSFGVIILCIIYPLIGIAIFKVEADLGKVILSILNMYPAILLIITVTSLIGTVARRKITTIGLSAGFVLVSYFINFLGEAASETFAATLQQFSFFYHSNGTAIVLDTFNPLTSIVLMSVAIVCLGLSVVMFNRRDIGL